MLAQLEGIEGESNGDSNYKAGYGLYLSYLLRRL